MIFQPHKSLLRGKKLLFNTGELGAIVEVLVITLFDEEYRGPSRFCNAISKSHLFGFCVGHRRAHGFLDERNSAFISFSVALRRAKPKYAEAIHTFLPEAERDLRGGQERGINRGDVRQAQLLRTTTPTACLASRKHAEPVPGFSGAVLSCAAILRSLLPLRTTRNELLLKCFARVGVRIPFCRPI